MKKNKFELYTSASAAAVSAGSLKTKFEIETAAHTAFKAGNNNAADWEYWSDTFYRLRDMFNTLRAEPAPSALLEQAQPVAAKTEPAK